MNIYRPLRAALTRIARPSPWALAEKHPRPQAETRPRPYIDPVAYAAALEVLG